MKKKWIIIFVSAFAGIFALIYFAGFKNATKISFHNNENTESIAKKIKTTPDSDWILDPTIPGNYVPVPGEVDLFMVLNEDGTVKEYRRRIKQEDGSWAWETVENPTGKEVEKVKETPYGDLFKFTDDNGFEEYKRFVLDENNGFTWVDTDETGLDLGLPTTSQLPENFVAMPNNTFAYYNDKGVLQSYLQRTVNDDGSYNWSLVSRPDMIAYQSFDREDELDISDFGQSLVGTDFQFGDTTYSDEVWSPSGDTKTQTVKYPEQEEIDGYIIVYETVITTVSDKEGNILSTKKDRFEKGRYPAMGDSSVTGTMSKTLSGEAQRLSSQVSYRIDIANQLLDALNTERSKNGKQPLGMDTGDLYALSQIKAADMGITSITSKTSSTYGTIKDLATRYQAQVNNPEETVVEAYPTDITAIHNKFMSDATVKNYRLSANRIAISVVENNGKIYVSECYSF